MLINYLNKKNASNWIVPKFCEFINSNQLDEISHMVSHLFFIFVEEHKHIISIITYFFEQHWLVIYQSIDQFLELLNLAASILYRFRYEIDMIGSLCGQLFVKFAKVQHGYFCEFQILFPYVRIAFYGDYAVIAVRSVCHN